MSVTAIQIDDDLIDDSHCLDEQFTSFSGQKCIDGCVINKYIDKGEYKDGSALVPKNVLEFKRTENARSEYIIKPERNSDYEITVDCDADITIEKENFLGQFRPIDNEKIVEYENGKMIVALDSNKSYKVTVSSKPLSDYTVKFSHDNWVYAPNGGYYTTNILSDNIDSTIYATTCTIKLYINQNMMQNLKDHMILHVSNNYEANDKMATVGLLTTGAGTGISIAVELLALPAAVSPVGIGIGFFGLMLAIDSKMDAYNSNECYKEYKNIVLIDKDNAIVFRKRTDDYSHITENSFEKWESVGYINKYDNNIRGNVIVHIEMEDIKWLI